MRYVPLGVLIGLLLVFGTAGPVQADGDLTAAVAVAYFPRNVDAALHEIAHQRVAELRACRCLEHDRMRSGTAEVLAWNQGIANPVAAAVASWTRSALHHSILSNTSYGRIGCAEAADGSTHWFACVLSAGALPAGTQSAGSQPTGAAASHVVAALPDTAMSHRPIAWSARARVVPI
jgi:hypothetical protein